MVMMALIFDIKVTLKSLVTQVLCPKILSHLKQNLKR